MARGKTLINILNSVRAEARLSLQPAHNTQVRDSHVLLIQREQERLWEDFAWPHMRGLRLQPLSAGQYKYDNPTDLAIDRIEKVEAKVDGIWIELINGIRAEEYASYDSALDQRSWPPRRWQVTEDDQIEVWPIPDTNGVVATQEAYLRLTGIRQLGEFVDDTDTADLDDRLLVLYVAGGILAASGAKDAQLKLEAANRHYSKLKGSQMKTKSFNMFGTTNVRRHAAPRINTFRPPST